MYNKIFNLFIKRYLKIPKLEVIISDNGEQILINGNELSQDDIQRIQQEALMLQKSLLLKGVFDAIREKAVEDLLLNSKVTEELYFPRATLYIVDSIQAQINNSTERLLDKDTKKNYSEDRDSTLSF